MWDWVIGIGVIVGFILVVWARVSRMTIPELFREIKDVILDTKEDMQGDITYGYYE